MAFVTSLIGIGHFSVALYLFLAGPEQREETLALIGASLEYRTVTGLSIVGMVFGVVFTLRALFESVLSTGRARSNA